MSVSFFDPDGFKEVNDSQEHAAGGKLLQTVATRLRQRMWAHGRVVRVGGDGFVLRLPALAAARKWTVCRARPIRPCSVRRPVVEGSS